MRTVLGCLLGLWLAGAARGMVLADDDPSPAAERPNVLFILTDDQGWPTLGCYGNRHVPTPHLDRLASEGLRFTQAYATPQCTPTRASLFTGQHTARNGMWHVIGWYGTPWAPVHEPPFVEQLPRSTFTLPKAMRAAGYRTGMAGKWHLTSNEDGNYQALKPQAADAYGFDVVAPPGPPEREGGDKQVDYLTVQAIEFIRRERDRPWYFYLAHHTVHGKVYAPTQLVEKHRQRGAPAEGMHNATYLAAIEHLDNSIGRILAELAALDLSRRTIVVFVSDNGGVERSYDAADFTGLASGQVTQLTVKEEQFDNAPLRSGKGSPYEGGLRVPCIVRWPGVIQPNQTCETPIHVVDWLPTLLDIAQAQSPAEHPIDGVSLRPLFRGEPLAERALYWHMPLYDLRWGATPCSVIRQGPWKLIEYYGDSFDASGKYHQGRKLELFNLADDLGEARDLAADQPERAAQLQQQLRAWLTSLKAEIPGPNPRHDPARPLLETRVKP